MKLKKIFISLIAVLSLVSCGSDDDGINVVVFSPTELQYSMIGGTGQFMIYYDGDWAISITDTEFVTSVSPMSGTGFADITVTVGENTTGVERETSLKINGQTFYISQNGNPEVKYENVIGIWTTEDGSYFFDFSVYLTFEAIISGESILGTYDIEDNIITIKNADETEQETITVKDAQEETMICTIDDETITLVKM